MVLSLKAILIASVLLAAGSLAAPILPPATAEGLDARSSTAYVPTARYREFSARHRTPSGIAADLRELHFSPSITRIVNTEARPLDERNLASRLARRDAQPPRSRSRAVITRSLEDDLGLTLGEPTIVSLGAREIGKCC